MSAPRHTLFSTILIVIAGLTPLHAIPVRFLAWDDSIAARKIGLSNGTEAAELQNLHPHNRSKSINLVIGEVPPVLVALDKPSADGKPVTAPIKITPDLTSPLVLILPDSAHPSGLRCFVIEDSAGSFSWGSFRFINATGKELLVRNEKVTKSLPKIWQAIDINPGGAVRNMGIQLAARDNLTAIIYSAVWEYDPNVRKLIIVEWRLRSPLPRMAEVPK